MKKIPLNRTSIEMFAFLIILYITWFTTAHVTRMIDIKHSSLLGVVDDIHTNYRDRSEMYIIFKNTNKKNQLSLLFNYSVFKEKGIVNKEDSIYKQMFTQGYDVYREVDGEYVFLYHINSKKWKELL